MIIALSLICLTGCILCFRGMRGAIHVAFEEGTQAEWLHDLLVLVVDRVVVAIEGEDGRLTPEPSCKGIK